jgi:4-aminobutyrate aminotransferase-like enzyme
MALRAKTKPRDIRREDQKRIGRDSPPHDVEVVAAEGSLVHDVRGRTYIDFTMGWCVGNLGWSCKPITERVAAFEGPDYVLPAMTYGPWVEIARRLAEITPGELERCYRVTTGTEAVEVAMQIARAYTGRDRVISIEDDYHGNSIAVKEIERLVKPPLDERALARLERTLATRKVAAFMMEPIIMNLGVELPSTAFMQGAAALCKKYGTLFVIDEVACGFGRTGRMFACEHFGIEPDILCMAKALTNGVAPMAATITTAEIGDEVAGDLDFYATFGWLPRSCEAALATLDVWRDQGEAVLANVAAREAQAIRRLHDLLPDECTARVKGLAIGIDLPEELEADAIGDRCRRRGLLVSAEEDQLLLIPALTIDADTFDRGLDIVGEALSG